MTLIEWREEFSVGVESVDSEHREMIALINELDGAMRHAADCATVIRTLGEMLARISAHFALEEKVMKDAAYEGFAAHKADHEQLLDDLLDTIDSVEEAGHYDREALSGRLNQWFSDHFRTHDAKLHRHIG